MCSLSGSVITEENNLKTVQLNVCKKCLIEKPSVVLRNIDAYCKSCFLPATVHKFRATLGKYRIMRPNEKVLILYQTGHPTTALLHFIRSGLDLSTHKKLRLDPVILYIDEQQNITEDERLQKYNDIVKEVKSHNFTGYITSLHSFDKDTNTLKYIEMNNLKEEDIQIFDFHCNKSFPNITLKDDTSNILRRQLLLEMAKKLNCRIVFTPDISIDVAINMLSNLSLGRGSHLSLDVGIIDDRDPDIKILQPIRYFDMKELAFYNIFNNLQPVNLKKYINKATTPSVINLISKFVQNLQENYPSTIKTIVRTGDKLTCEKNGNNCTLCKAPIEMQEDLSSSEARDFSHWISTHANDSINCNDFSDNTIKNNLCYGCKNVASFL